MSAVRRPVSELDRWFAAEILPHEAALTRYLRRVWRNTADTADLRQDVYVRVYESAAHSRPQQPKSFLFAIARTRRRTFIAGPLSGRMPNVVIFATV